MSIEAYRAKARINHLSKEDVMQHFEFLKDDGYFKEVETYIDDKVFGHKHALVFTNYKSRVVIQCTKCGHEEITRKAPKHCSDQICSGCQRTMKAKNSKYNQTWQSELNDVIYFSKSTLDQSVLAGYQVSVKQKLIKTDTNKAVMDYEYANSAFYVFDFFGKNTCMYESYWSGESSFTKTIYAFNSSKAYFWGVAMESLEKAVEGTPYQYLLKNTTRQPGYLKNACATSHIPKLLDSYSTKCQAIELLYSAGFEHIADTKIFGYRNYNTVNWKGKTITEALRLPRYLIKHFVNDLKKNTCTYFLKVIQHCHKRKMALKEIEAAVLMAQSYHNLNLEIFIGLLVDKPTRMLNYFRKQIEKYPKRYSQLGSVIRDFKDLLQDIKELNLDLTNRNMYPKNLNKHHQNLQKQIKIKADEFLDEQIKKRAEKLQKLQYENDQYLVKNFECIQEIIDEGAQLEHCVGRYAERHAKGNTTLLALRKKDDPSKPFYTIEISLEAKKIYQCRGWDNGSITLVDGLPQFVDDFENNILKGSTNGKQASRSIQRH
jgi:hypothetical protein